MTTREVVGFPTLLPWHVRRATEVGGMELFLPRQKVVFSLNMVPTFYPKTLHLPDTDQES